MSICYVLHELPIGVTLGASSEAKVPPVPGPSLSAAPYLSPLHLLPDTPSVLPHMSGGGNDLPFAPLRPGDVLRCEELWH